MSKCLEPDVLRTTFTAEAQKCLVRKFHIIIVIMQRFYVGNQDRHARRNDVLGAERFVGL
jgi:hypothetical protein